MDRRSRNRTAVITVKNVTVSKLRQVNYIQSDVIPATPFAHDRAQIPFAAYTGEIVGGIAGALLFISVLVVLILYRNWKYEQELDSLLWKVNYKDIEVKEKKDEAAVANEAPAKCNSKVSARGSRFFAVTSDISIDRTEFADTN